MTSAPGSPPFQPGVVSVRLSGDPAALNVLAAALAAHPAVEVLTGPGRHRPNRHEPGARAYLTIRLRNLPSRAGAGAQPPSNPSAPAAPPMKEDPPVMTVDQLTAELTARLGGPHGDEHTAAAAHLAAEAARFLNYATGPHVSEGLTVPATVDLVTGNLAELAGRLPQLCGQLGDYLTGAFAAGQLADIYGRLPYHVISQARRDLDTAAHLADGLGRALQAAQSATSGLCPARGREGQ